MKMVRVGVGRLREELAALLGVEVGEVAGPSRRGAEVSLPETPVLVGTEAVLHRARHAAAVAFLDIDLHLLAARLSATEETLALFVRAARLVGPRDATSRSRVGLGGGGARATASRTARIQVQTRVPDHPVLAAVARGEPASVLAEEAKIRRTSGLPPYSALALVSGPLAPDFVASLGPLVVHTAVSVTDLGEGRHLVRAPDHGSLCDLLAEAPRPSGRGLRIAVDPADL